MPDRLEVLSPSGRLAAKAIDNTAAISDLNGRRVAFIWDYLFKGDVMWEVVSAELTRRWPEIKLIGPDEFGDIHGADELNVVAALPAKLAEHRIDAAVVGVGACGSCSPAVVRAMAVCERAHVPAVGLIASGFVTQAKTIGRALGLSTTQLAVYSGVIMTDGREEVLRKSEEEIAPAVVAALTDASARMAAADSGADAESYSQGIVFSGTYDEVSDYFEEMLWSDGLPIVPPTRERVDAALKHVNRSPDEVLGTLLPGNREATILNVAVNGVVAGCKPEHLPILVAAVEAMAEPVFRLEDLGCTAGWDTLAIVSGPNIQELGFNSKQGALRNGVRANTTIGRFFRLYARNVADIRIPPAATDKTTLGQNFPVAIAEDDDAVRGVGWPTLREELGYSDADTVVLTQSLIGSSLPIYSAGETPDPHLDIIAAHIAGVSGHYSYLSVRWQSWYPVLVVSPSVARVFASSGMTKADVAAELANRARVPASQWQGYAKHPGTTDWDLERDIATGWAGPAYSESTDPDRLIPVMPRSEWLAIVVAGDPDRNQSKFLMNNHAHGPRRARRAAWA